MITTVDLADAERCAKGPKQLALIRELAEGPVARNQVKTVQFYFVTTYGQTGLPESSFRPLQDRLKEAGFSVRKNPITQAVEVFR